MAEGSISVFLKALFAKFNSSEFKLVTEKRVQEEVMKLESSLLSIRAVVADAESREGQDQAMKNWLAELQELAYDIDDILNDFATEALRPKLKKEHHSDYKETKIHFFIRTWRTSLHPSSILFNYKMMRKIKAVTARLEVLEEQASDLQLEKITGIEDEENPSLKSYEEDSIKTSTDQSPDQNLCVCQRRWKSENVNLPSHYLLGTYL